MTHAEHRAYKKVDQRNRPCDLREPHRGDCAPVISILKFSNS